MGAISTQESGRARYWRDVRAIADQEGVTIPEARSIWREQGSPDQSRFLEIHAQPVVTQAHSRPSSTGYAPPKIKTRPTEVANTNAPIILSVAACANTRRKCPYCQDELDQPGDPDTLSCPACETRYHEPCWAELRACAIRGCKGRQTAPQKNSQTPVVSNHSRILLVTRLANLNEEMTRLRESVKDMEATQRKYLFVILFDLVGAVAVSHAINMSVAAGVLAVTLAVALVLGSSLSKRHNMLARERDILTEKAGINMLLDQDRA